MSTNTRNRQGQDYFRFGLTREFPPLVFLRCIQSRRDRTKLSHEMIYRQLSVTARIEGKFTIPKIGGIYQCFVRANGITPHRFSNWPRMINRATIRFGIGSPTATIASGRDAVESQINSGVVVKFRSFQTNLHLLG